MCKLLTARMVCSKAWCSNALKGKVYVHKPCCAGDTGAPNIVEGSTGCLSKTDKVGPVEWMKCRNIRAVLGLFRGEEPRVG